jgi:cathepsin L
VSGIAYLAEKPKRVKCMMMMLLMTRAFVTICSVLLLTCSTFSAKASALPRTPSTSDLILLDETAYSFEQFLSNFGRFYHDAAEYAEHKAIFYENLHHIVQHNQKKKQDTGGYWMGINLWADRRPGELLKGYDKYQSSRIRSQQQTVSVQRRLKHDHDATEKLPIRNIDAVHDLPKSVDWRTHGVTTPVKSQGMCGSCWAFASTAVLESHIAIQTGILYELSPQELVSCAPNKGHCGGTGGCAGSTAEQAFEFVKQSGMLQEWQFGYQDGEGDDINCTLAANYKLHRAGNQIFHGAVVGIADYAVLPSNNYTVLMNVVAKLGPVAVSVACMPWHLYQSGVFYAPLTRGRATDLDHLVVLEGYGTDEESGEDYWLVRNSWGPRWGENGYIRLKRVGDTECGVDETPEDGTACTVDPDGHEIVPAPQTICGNSGILFDTAIPLGGYLI